jgi:hypothetical protein
MIGILPSVSVSQSMKKENACVTAEYQVAPYDYYVKDYFLAKSLIYVLRYINDDMLFTVAVDEAAIKCKIPRTDIIAHVEKIKSLK